MHGAWCRRRRRSDGGSGEISEDWHSIAKTKKMFSYNMRLFECTPPTEFIPHIILFGFFPHHSSLTFDNQNHNHSNSMLRFFASLSPCALSISFPLHARSCAHLSNGQIILVLFTTASHIALCLRFRDIHFYRYVSYIFFSSREFRPTSTPYPSLLLRVSLWIYDEEDSIV